MRKRELSKALVRCVWVKLSSPLYISYHDTEWGVPVFDDRKLFEFIVLESAQAGLSWETILNKREGYRRAFKDFDPKRVARFSESDIQKCLNDTSIVRNERKIRATVANARAFLDIQREHGSFSSYMWSWTQDVPHAKRQVGTNAVTSPLAIEMSRDLKKRGFSFLGPIVWYSHMQAVGMVNDHDSRCFRHAEIESLHS